jgi:hypothetical protein
MITPEEIRRKALRLWENQTFLRARMEGRAIFPWEVPFTKPAERDWSEGFAKMRQALQTLQSKSKASTRFGYRLDYQEVTLRRLGAQRLPARIVIETEEDFLRLTGKTAECRRFDELLQQTEAALPALRPLIQKWPRLLLDHHAEWNRLLLVCRYFLKHPRCGLYPRQLEIPNVDTKFLQAHRAILAELLNHLLPEPAIDRTVDGLSDHGFERRFGLRFESPSIRFRLLDPRMAITGLTDLSVPLPEFAALSLRPERVYITENKTNGLAFPPCANGMVIFGLGYGIGSLAAVDWLKGCDVRYWGDIDTHGFAILNRLRGFLPQTQSFLMDEPTLQVFKEFWGQEPEDRRFLGALERLEAPEQALFQALRDNRFGERLRLEQERIGFSYVKERL